MTPLAQAVALAARTPQPPYEHEGEPPLATPLDEIVFEALRERGLTPANHCSDAVFVRRVHLDLIGTMPEPRAVEAFLTSRDPNKRSSLVEELLARGEFADYWSVKWCDLLRVKAEFPINLWPNAVQAYHRWIRDALRANTPYDEFARALLTSSGSNFRVPPVNFYRAIQGREPAAIASAVALTFMGARTERWSDRQRADMAAFFSRVAFKGTDEWKEEIVCLDPRPAGALDAVCPDGTAVRIPPEQDPREVFTDWLLAPENPWFARAVVNRVWSWMMGRGIVHEPDDIRADNPPTIPELLTHLETSLRTANYDLRRLFGLIVNSRTYQQSSIPHTVGPEVDSLFACYPVRRLDAEVLIDALCWLSGDTEHYESPIPEPFTYIPEEHRTIELADGSITSPFLESFGRPPRDTGLESERNNEPTDGQRLYLLNSTDIHEKITRSARLRGILALAGGDDAKVLDWLYLTVLSRHPTEEETLAVRDHFRGTGRDLLPAAQDVAWALVNTKEFLYRH